MCVTRAAHPGMLTPSTMSDPPYTDTAECDMCRPWKEQRRDTGGEGPRVDKSPGAARTRVLGAVTWSRQDSRGPGSTLGRGGGPTRWWGSPRALQSQHRVAELLTGLDTQPPSGVVQEAWESLGQESVWVGIERPVE